MNALVVIALADYLLASGSEEKGVFILGSVAPFHITQGRVCINYTGVAETPQSHQILGLSKTVQPPTTESQRPEILVDHA